MPSKRAAARRDAAEPIDIESRLAPFFSPPPTDLHAPIEDAHRVED